MAASVITVAGLTVSSGAISSGAISSNLLATVAGLTVSSGAIVSNLLFTVAGLTVDSGAISSDIEELGATDLTVASSGSAAGLIVAFGAASSGSAAGLIVAFGAASSGSAAGLIVAFGAASSDEELDELDELDIVVSADLTVGSFEEETSEDELEDTTGVFTDTIGAALLIRSPVEISLRSSNALLNSPLPNELILMVDAPARSTSIPVLFPILTITVTFSVAPPVFPIKYTVGSSSSPISIRPCIVPVFRTSFSILLCVSTEAAGSAPISDSETPRIGIRVSRGWSSETTCGVHNRNELSSPINSATSSGRSSPTFSDAAIASLPDISS